jgi:hypothetical protein
MGDGETTRTAGFADGGGADGGGAATLADGSGTLLAGERGGEGVFNAGRAAEYARIAGDGARAMLSELATRSAPVIAVAPRRKTLRFRGAGRMDIDESVSVRSVGAVLRASDSTARAPFCPRAAASAEEASAAE